MRDVPTPVIVVLAIVALVVGVKLVSALMSLLWLALFGAAIGLAARTLLPERMRVALLPAIGFGVVGAVAGSVIARSILHLGWVLSVAVEVGLAAALIAGFGKRLPRP